MIVDDNDDDDKGSNYTHQSVLPGYLVQLKMSTNLI